MFLFVSQSRDSTEYLYYKYKHKIRSLGCVRSNRGKRATAHSFILTLLLFLDIIVHCTLEALDGFVRDS
jgi:hypothetical protein